MTLILDGKLARAFYAKRLKEQIVKLPKKLCLAIIQVGEREESLAYIKSKIKFGEDVGVEVKHIKFPESVAEKEIADKILLLNQDKNINGVIVQLPIPENLSKQKIIDAIIPEKDIDGLTSKVSLSRENGDREAIMPATARGVIELLKFYKIPIENKKVAVLGRSILAGAPIKEAVTFEGGVATVCHSQTPRAEEIKITKESDIVIVAIGKPKFLTVEFFNAEAGQVVIDVGINPIVESAHYGASRAVKLLEEIPKAKFVGDVDFEKVKPMVFAISPVPGGVGQMTVLALFENLFDCSRH